MLGHKATRQLHAIMAAWCCALAWSGGVADAFDIAPFALPNTPANELWFEEPRDIIRIEAEFNGMYFGAGGFEHGNYNQHHAWVLWALCEHLVLTGDETWFRDVAGSVIAGVDWVFRQRQNTMTDLPHSRGWEHGFLPAGSLEDVEDFHYWLKWPVRSGRQGSRVDT